MEKRIHQGGTLKVYTEWYNYSDEFTNPTTLSLNIWKPDGTLYTGFPKTIGDWTKEPATTGIYYYIFVAAANDPLGKWQVRVVATIDGTPEPETGTFEVIP